MLKADPQRSGGGGFGGWGTLKMNSHMPFQPFRDILRPLGLRAALFPGLKLPPMDRPRATRAHNTPAQAARP
jgi:hypothetical protein